MTGAAAPSRDSWIGEAACAGKPVGVFFPPAYNDRCMREAKRTCAGCSCRTKCLEWAIATGQSDGVFGGMSPEERRREWRQRQRRAPRTMEAGLMKTLKLLARNRGITVQPTKEEK